MSAKATPVGPSKFCRRQPAPGKTIEEKAASAWEISASDEIPSRWMTDEAIEESDKWRTRV